MAGCPLSRENTTVHQNYSSLSAVQKKVYDEKGEYLKAWTVVDAGLSWKMTDALTLNAAVNNLLNKDYSDVSLYSAVRVRCMPVITSRRDHQQQDM